MGGKLSLVRVISYYVIDDLADREKDGADLKVFSLRIGSESARMKICVFIANLPIANIVPVDQAFTARTASCQIVHCCPGWHPGFFVGRNKILWCKWRKTLMRQRLARV